MLPASPYVRYGVAVLCALGFLHVVGQHASPAYSHRTSLDAAKVKLGLKPKPPGETWLDGKRVAPWEEVDARIPGVSLDDDEQRKTPPERENATFVMLARYALLLCCSGVGTNNGPRPETRTSGARSTRSVKSRTASTASSTTTGPSSTTNRSTTSSRRTSRPSAPARSSSVKCRRSTGARTFPSGLTFRKRTSSSTRWGRNRSRTGGRSPM